MKKSILTVLRGTEKFVDVVFCLFFWGNIKHLKINKTNKNELSRSFRACTNAYNDYYNIIIYTIVGDAWVVTKWKKKTKIATLFLWRLYHHVSKLLAGRGTLLTPHIFIYTYIYKVYMLRYSFIYIYINEKTKWEKNSQNNLTNFYHTIRAVCARLLRNIIYMCIREQHNGLSWIIK